ncbi:MAG TPA: alpha/beta fold hydrolase [Aurantimonas sp.]|jgi:pimeloyl-ACP methyl ester carboxylesterase|nr:alpha/beta fold hydrolase [Aurantimonas sp.]
MALPDGIYRVEMVNSQPVVLIPGLLCTGELFREQIRALDGEVVQVADVVRDDSIAGMAERLLATAPPRFVLCGLSMGGYVALETARRSPERVAGLVLVATSARPDTPEQTATRHRLVALARQKGIAAVADALSPRLLGPVARRNREFLDRVTQMAETVGVEAFARQQKAIIERSDQRPVLSRLTIPTAVLVGTADEIIPMECSQEMASAIPDARLRTIEGAGHLLSMEAPEIVTAALRASSGAESLPDDPRRQDGQFDAGPNM